MLFRFYHLYRFPPHNIVGLMGQEPIDIFLLSLLISFTFSFFFLLIKYEKYTLESANRNNATNIQYMIRDKLIYRSISKINRNKFRKKRRYVK